MIREEDARHSLNNSQHLMADDDFSDSQSDDDKDEGYKLLLDDFNVNLGIKTHPISDMNNIATRIIKFEPPSDL